jgi:hypothetical protein
VIYLWIRRLPPMIVAHWPLDLGAQEAADPGCPVETITI